MMVLRISSSRSDVTILSLVWCSGARQPGATTRAQRQQCSARRCARPRRFASRSTTWPHERASVLAGGRAVGRVGGRRTLASVT